MGNVVVTDAAYGRTHSSLKLIKPQIKPELLDVKKRLMMITASFVLVNVALVF